MQLKNTIRNERSEKVHCDLDHKNLESRLCVRCTVEGDLGGQMLAASMIFPEDGTYIAGVPAYHQATTSLRNVRIVIFSQKTRFGDLILSSTVDLSCYVLALEHLHAPSLVLIQIYFGVNVIRDFPNFSWISENYAGQVSSYPAFLREWKFKIVA